MKNIAIQAQNIGKQYRLGEVGTGTISHDLNRLWAKMRGKPDPFLKIGESNDRSTKSSSDYVWALRDINFDIQQGDAVGIIGRNGAGKSTLLKILSRTTSPTIGSLKVRGRIASLLEVGTGFQPELTGRENIYQNGAILGMRKAEITRKMDEIIDFSGCERYIDTPVKRYSSGMYVRLAFAVAAHLESEILVVDEVLAVGDAEFQKKCLGKMGDISRGEGRTLLFVSHNLSAIKQLCSKALLLHNGCLVGQGTVDAIATQYATHDSIENDMKTAGLVVFDHKNTPIHARKKALITEIKLIQNNQNTSKIDNNTDFFIEVTYEILENVPDFAVYITIANAAGDCVIHSSDIFFDKQNTINPRTAGHYTSKMCFRQGFMNTGTYKISVSAEMPHIMRLFYYYQIIDFEVHTSGIDGRKFSPNKWRGVLMPSFFEWDVHKKIRNNLHNV